MMMRRSIAKLQRNFSRIYSNIDKLLQFYSDTQNYSIYQLENFQNKRLNELINHCYKNVPYYKKFLDKKKIRGF